MYKTNNSNEMQQGKNPMPTPRGAFETRWKGPLFACSWLFYPWVEFGSSKKPLSKWKIKRDIVARDKKNRTSTDKTNKTCTKKTCTNKTKRASENNGRGLARERVIPCFSFRKDQDVPTTVVSYHYCMDCHARVLISATRTFKFGSYSD